MTERWYVLVQCDTGAHEDLHYAEARLDDLIDAAEQSRRPSGDDE